MKIAVHPAETVRAVFDSPAPLDARQLDLLQEPLIDEVMRFGIIIDQPHDALAVAQEVADPSRIEAGGIELDGMDIDEMVRKRQGPLEVLFPGVAAFPDPVEVVEISPAVRKLSEQKELPGLAR